MKQKYIIYTDGGSRGNPGNAGCGAVVCDAQGKVLKKAGKNLGTMTNNEAEYSAVILGLDTLKKLLGSEKTALADVEIRLDSELVGRQLSGQYQIKEERLFPFFMKVWNYRVKDFTSLKFVNIPREENNIADGLANEAMDEVSKKTSLF